VEEASEGCGRDFVREGGRMSEGGKEICGRWHKEETGSGLLDVWKKPRKAVGGMLRGREGRREGGREGESCKVGVEENVNEFGDVYRQTNPRVGKVFE